LDVTEEQIMQAMDALDIEVPAEVLAHWLDHPQMRAAMLLSHLLRETEGLLEKALDDTGDADRYREYTHRVRWSDHEDGYRQNYLNAKTLALRLFLLTQEPDHPQAVKAAPYRGDDDEPGDARALAAQFYVYAAEEILKPVNGRLARRKQLKEAAGKAQIATDHLNAVARKHMLRAHTNEPLPSDPDAASDVDPVEG